MPVLKPKKSIAEVINVRKYFEQRKNRLSKREEPRDPIAELEEKRKFNAAALRFAMT